MGASHALIVSMLRDMRNEKKRRKKKEKNLTVLPRSRRNFLDDPR
jgi:hypothetical protein